MNDHLGAYLSPRHPSEWRAVEYDGAYAVLWRCDVCDALTDDPDEVDRDTLRGSR